MASDKHAPRANGPEGSILDGAHSQGRGLLTELDPRAKLLTALGFSLVVSLCVSQAVAAVALGLGLAVMLAARLGPRVMIRRTATVNVFVIFLWLFLPWRLEIGQGVSQASLVFNPPGLSLAWLITLKVNAIFFVLTGLLATSRVNDLLHAMAHLRLPSKLVTIFLLFFRYLFVLHREYQRLTQAMRVRCFTPGSNLHTYRTYANVVGMLLVRSFDRAERVFQAMLCRGFNGTFWVLDHFAWRRRDTVFSAGAALALAGLILLQWGI